MTKKKTTPPEYVTREILKEEINHLDAKIDSKVDAATQSMKEYTDSRFTQLDTKIDGLEQKMETRFEKMETRFDKFERYFEQLVGMVVGQTKKIDSVLERVENHEQRITKLEEDTT